MKVQLSMNDDLLGRLDKCAKDNYLSRSALVSIAVNQYLNANEMVSAIKEMSLIMRKIADTGEVDDDTREKLEDFERFAKLMTGATK